MSPPLMYSPEEMINRTRLCLAELLIFQGCGPSLENGRVVSRGLVSPARGRREPQTIRLSLDPLPELCIRGLPGPGKINCPPCIKRNNCLCAWSLLFQINDTCQIATKVEVCEIHVGQISINPINIEYLLSSRLQANVLDVKWLATIMAIDVVLHNCLCF